MAVDEQILVAGTSAVPLSYTVPNAIEAALLCVNATVDGTAAPSSFLATVEIVSDGGVVVARCPCFTTIPAGGSAEVSWFRLRESTIATTPTATPYEELMLSTGGLQLYWKLDDAPGSLTIADSKGSNTGTVYGTVTLGEPALADGTSCLYAGGMTGTKHVDFAVDQTTQKMTVIIWLKATVLPAVSYIAWADTNDANGRWFQWFITAAGHIGMTVFNLAAAGVTMGGSVAVNDGNKHMVAFVYDATVPATGVGATGKIYVDGVLDTSSALAMGGSGLANTNHGGVLGAEWRNAFDDPAGINHFPGTLDEFALFNVPLTQPQLAAINTAGRV